MTTMSESRMRLHFLSLISLCCVSPSSFVTADYFESPVVGLVACRPKQIQAFTKFKNEFDTSHCNHSDPYNGVWCDNSTSAITKLRLSACLSGTLKPNSTLFTLHHLRHLQLSQNNFSSSLPSEFGNLNRLEVLSLSKNGFVGQVPSSFNNLSQLSYLSVFRNELTGSFPLMRNLTALVVLDLSHNHFYGTLNPNSSLFQLHHLRYLNLGYNNFSSSLPSEFGNLNRLESLTLSYNKFFGQVPPTTTMPFLSYLNLRGNNFSGSIVFLNSSFSSSKLEDMDLGYNYFDGKIIEHISKLINLQWLDLSFFLNTSSYPLDVSLFSSLKSLWYLDLSRNNISPPSLGSKSDIPPNLETLVLHGCGISKFPNVLKILQKLKIVYLSDNRITGKVPEWLWKLPRLSAVMIYNNSFNGFQGPAEVMINSSVKILDLSQNFVEGEIPILPLSIKVFAAQRNRFTGSIPLSICNCRSLTYLTLSFNNLTGPIPHCLSRLMFVNLRKNNLEGSIPDDFYAGASLQSLDVGYNRLTGKLPRSLLNCSSLRFISVDNNKIQDTFPFWLKSLPKLQVLNLRSNNFFGPISPSDQGSLGFLELRIFEISDNKFSGSLSPSYFENWKASSLLLNENDDLYMEYKKTVGGIKDYRYMNTMDLRYKGRSMEQQQVFTSYAAIDFSGNKLEGQIPESIGLLKALNTLNLSNNTFTGHIPLSFSNLSNLESLDLSSNQLSGTIPNGLRSLSFLAYINVSHNQLKGEIPQGTQITGQPKSSFEGNKGLCGLPLQETCFDTHAPPTQHPEDEGEEEEEEEALNWNAVAIGCGTGVFFGLAIGQVFASYKPEGFVKILVRIRT